MAKGIKGSEIVIINDVGHEIYVNQATGCIREVNAFTHSLERRKNPPNIENRMQM